MDHKKLLKQKYKEMKTPMGVYTIKNHVNGKIYIDASIDTKSSINKHRFQLQWGGHPMKELQRDWKRYEDDAFSFEVIEQLEYDEKEEKTDYGEELEILKMVWIEKLKNNKKIQFYNIK